MRRCDIFGQKVFRAKFYIKRARAPGHLPLPSQFQKSLNSFPLIGQKNIFLPNISTRRTSRATLVFLFEVVFLIDRSSYLVRTTVRFSWRWFQKKDPIKPWKSQAVTWAQRNNTRRLIFTVDFNSETLCESLLHGSRDYVDRTWGRSTSCSAPLAPNQKSLTNMANVNSVGRKFKWISIKQVQKYNYEHFSQV